jgi:hypothetical protein
LTVTVAVALLTVPHELETRTQYEVVAVGVTVRDGPVAPEIGLAVFPLAPVYHWYVSEVPVAATDSVAEEPDETDMDCGCEVIAGAVHDGGGGVVLHEPPGYTDCAALMSHVWSA